MKNNYNQFMNKQNILFFDMDGTLVDTDYANYLAYQQSIEIVIGRKNMVEVNDKNRFDNSMLINFYTNLTTDEYNSIVNTKGNLYEQFLSETKLNDKLANTLYEAANNHKTVLVTNANKARSLLTLKHHGIVDYFNHLFFGEDVIRSHGKYENAILSLGVKPDEVVIFENEYKEIYQAKNIGFSNNNIVHI